MTVRPTTQHDIQRDDENTSRQGFAVAQKVLISGSLVGLIYTGIDLGTGNATIVVTGTPPSPGGRLTLVTGTPVTSSDVTGATSIYYLPYIHDGLLLWDGTSWILTRINNTPTLALGTVVTGTGYDVFAYLNSGTVALEKLAWTNGITRTTTITQQDGRYCKSTDKTRLYMGSFYPTSTTQTEDSEAKRFLWNMYNRVPRSLKVENSTSHNYNVATIRPWNNDQAGSDFEYFVGLVEDALVISHIAQITRVSTDGNPRSRFGVNSITTEQGIYGLAIATLAGRLTGGGTLHLAPSLGYSFACILEFSTVGTAPGATFEAAALTGDVQA